MALGGILAGALAGGGEAVQYNAKSQIEQKRAEALKRLDNDLAMERQNDSQQFQTSEREAKQTYQTGRDETLQGYKQDNTRLTHGLNMEQERYRQGQQNYRNEAGSWQTMQNADGSFTQYNPITNETRPLPEGLNPGVSGELSGRQSAMLEDLQSQREMLGERLNGDVPLDPATEQQLRDELDTVNAKVQRILQPSGGNDLSSMLDDALGSQGVGSRDAGGGNTDRQGRDAPPPNSARGLIRRQQQEAQQRQQDNAFDREVDDSLTRADRVLDSVLTPEKFRQAGLGFTAGTAGSTSMGITDEQRQQGEQMAAELMQLHDNPATSDYQKNQIMQKIYELQDAGVPLNVE